MTDDCPKISVTIPIYNCEKYIQQCATSLMEQSYSNIEYIFIDDCSTDNTLDVLISTLEKYPQRKEQVTIIPLVENHGSAYARNIGIASMTGDYYTFCDGDDWIEPQAYISMIKAAQYTQADIICTPFFINKPNRQYILRFPFNTISDLNQLPLDTIHFSLCNKCFKSNLFLENNIKVFENINCWDDLSIVARLYALSNKIAILDTPYYHYRKYISYKSLTASNHKRILKDHILCAIKLDEWFISQGNERYNSHARFLLFLKFTAKIKMLRGREKDFDGWKSTFPETNKHIMTFQNIPIHYRVLFKTCDLLPTPISKFINRISNMV